MDQSCVGERRSSLWKIRSTGRSCDCQTWRPVSGPRRPFIQLEGSGRPRNVVVKFESLEAAEACYKSPDYQAALVHAQDASERDLLLVETTD